MTLRRTVFTTNGHHEEFEREIDRALLRPATATELDDPGPGYFDERARVARSLAKKARGPMVVEWLRVATVFERTAESLRRAGALADARADARAWGDK